MHVAVVSPHVRLLTEGGAGLLMPRPRLQRMSARAEWEMETAATFCWEARPKLPGNTTHVLLVVLLK